MSRVVHTTRTICLRCAINYCIVLIVYIEIIKAGLMTLQLAQKCVIKD